MTILNESNIQDTTKKGLSLITFAADWCVACTKLTEKLTVLDNRIKNDRISFYYVDVDESPMLELEWNISHYPTLILMKDSKELSRTSGNMELQEIKKFIAASITTNL